MEDASVWWVVMSFFLLAQSSVLDSIIFPSSHKRWHYSNQKGQYKLHPVSQQFPQGYSQNSTNVGLVEYRSFLTSSPPQERMKPGLNPTCAGIFLRSSHTSDLKIGTPVTTLPGTWHYRVSVGTGWPSVNILWLGEVECLICSFYLSVAAHKIVWADPSLRYTHMLLGCYATNKQQPDLSSWIFHLFLSPLPLSFRWSQLWCSGLSLYRNFLKPLSTSALPSFLSC